MIIKPTGRCHYCGEAMSYNRPWHSECWLAAQRKANTRKPHESACWMRDCDRAATTYTKVYGYWERVCGHHADEGYSLDRSHEHVAEMLCGRKA